MYLIQHSVCLSEDLVVAHCVLNSIEVDLGLRSALVVVVLGVLEPVVLELGLLELGVLELGVLVLVVDVLSFPVGTVRAPDTLAVHTD